MYNCNLIVLSYHKFGIEPSDYRFSRTYDQLEADLDNKIFDWVTIDDGMTSMIKACDMMKQRNIRAKLFISTALVGTEGYCTWKQLDELAMFHDIENHSHSHEDLTMLHREDIIHNIRKASNIIEQEIGRPPRYFVPPYNKYNTDVVNIVKKYDLQMITDRVEIINETP